MYNGKRVLAIVTARGGSKGIPKKNLKEVGGISLVGRVGNIISQLDWIDRAVLSTDSEEIAQEGEKFGLDVPFLRPEDLSGDNVGSLEVIQHAFRYCEEEEGSTYDVMLLLEPTCPLRRAEDVTKVIDNLFVNNSDSAVSVSMIPFNHHPSKAMSIKGGKLAFYEVNGEKVKNRQMLEPVYSRNGIAYAVTRDCLISKNSLYGQDTTPVIIDRELVNIDDPEDLINANLVLEKQGK
jgi:CMP-N,N'-diacetyllegionaminic acid synthase